MKKVPELIVMLTHNDMTADNAAEVFELCKDLPVRIWGMKEEPLPLSEMKTLFSYMKELGKTTALEAVTYTEKESLAGAKKAAECGGLISGEHGIGYGKMDYLAAFAGETSMRLMKGIKEVFDPKMILNPGKVCYSL